MVLAILALVVAIAAVAVGAWGVMMSKQALAWQKERDRARLTPSVRIEFEHMGEPQGGPLYTAADLEDERPRRLFYVLRISGVNEGETTEHVKRLTIETADRKEGRSIEDDADWELKPRARVQTPFYLDGIPGWQSGFVAIASLAGGEEIESQVEHPYPDLLAEIEAHNRNARP